MRPFNTKLFLWLLGIVAVTAAATFLVHYLQTGRIAQALLWQARRAEEQGRLEETVRYLGRYLEFAPNDNEQRANLARVLANRVLDGDKSKVSYKARQQALFVLEGVVARDPQRQDMRQLLARVAMDLGRPDVAFSHLSQLHDQLPDNGEVDALLAQCQEAQEKYADAALLCWEAIQHAPHQRDSYVRLAALLRRPDRAQWPAPAKDPDQVLKKEPDQVLNLLVANNGDASEAYLARWRNRNRQDLQDPKKRAEAARDVEAALRLAPTEADTLLAAAELAQAEGDRARARGYLRKGCELHPSDKRLYLARADVELADGKPKEAVARLNEGLNVLHEQPDLLWLLANVLLDGGDLEPAGKAIVRLRKADGPVTGVDYLQARLLLGQGRWAEAARLLESTRPMMERDGAAPGLLDQVDLYLAGCYEQTDAPAQQVGAYDRLIAREAQWDHASPALVQAMQGRAQTLAGLGRLDEAVTQYQDLVRRSDAPKAAWMQLARLLLARDLVRGQRDWRDVEAALQRAGKEQPDAVEVPLLQARLLLLREEWDHAREVLEKARRDFPKKVEPWAALIELAELRKQPDQVAQLIKDAEQQTGDSIDLRLAKGRAWADVPKEKLGPFPTALTDGLKDFSAEDQTRLLRGLMESAYRAGKVPDALQLWLQLTSLPQHQHDARMKLVLIELALQAENETVLGQVLADLRRIEGGEGPLWSYGEALRLMRQAEKQPDAAVLDRAAALLGSVAGQRPGWAAVQLVLADVDKMRHNPDGAIVHLQKAIGLNERSPRVYRQLAQLLDQRGRTGEADEILRKLSPEALAEADLQWVATDIALRNHDPARAAELAMAAVAQDSTDYRDYLRRGSVLAVNGRPREAEGDLRRATELGGDRPETWLSLVAFLAGAGRADEARKVIEAVHAKLPADQVPLTLAQCCEVVGDVDKARQHYAEALQLKPAEFAVRAAAVGFYLKTGAPRDAESLLRPMVAGQVKLAESEAAWARRRLALLLASYPDEPHFAEALALVGLKVANGQVVMAGQPAAGSAEEQREEGRTRAQVLATRERHVCRSQAIHILEDMDQHASLTPDDQFLLARLCDMDGATARAHQLLVRLTANNGDNPAYLVYYARSLLRQHAANEAQHCVDQLANLEKQRQLEPGTWGSVELQAQVWEASGQGERALNLLESHARRPHARPEDVLPLIGCLTRQKQFDKALDTCTEVWRTGPAALAGRTSLAVLRAMRPTAEQCARVERHLQEARQKEPRQSILFLLYLADLYDVQARYDDAAAKYREVLKEEPDNVLALNNLAWLLAETSPDKDEALKLVEQAIELQGSRAELLDTRAVVEMARSQTEAAIRDLEQASTDQPDAPRYFRLAQAYYLAKDRDAALTALRRAKASGLKPEQLHPIEQTAFRKVTSELEPQ